MRGGARRARTTGLQIFCGDPRAIPPAKWNPISEPPWRYEWESRLSKLPFQNQWEILGLPHPGLTPTLAPTATFFFSFFFGLTTIINGIPLHHLTSATVKHTFHHSTCIVWWLRIWWGMVRDEGNLAHEAEGGGGGGWEETAKTVKEQAKGLYRKSITLFQFFFRHRATKGQSQSLSTRGTKPAFFPSQFYQLSPCE